MKKMVCVLIAGALAISLALNASDDKRKITVIRGMPFVHIPFIFDRLEKSVVNLTEAVCRKDMSSYKSHIGEISANIDLLENSGEPVESIIKEMARRLMIKDEASFINFANIYQAKAELEEESN